MYVLGDSGFWGEWVITKENRNKKARYAAVASFTGGDGLNEGGGGVLEVVFG